jgi:hypothetical protein
LNPRLSWPPPGLEALQGAVWPLIRSFAFGAILFATPVLVGVATRQSFNTLGPFGRSFWIPAVFSGFALLVLFDAALRLSAVLRMAATGAQLGYDGRTLALVATDGARDTGFILQGIRAYHGIDEDTRRSLLVTRAVGAFAYLGAALWLPFGVSLAILFAYLGLVGTGGVWLLAILPSAILFTAGWFARSTEGLIQRRLRKRVRHAEHEPDSLPQQVATWREQLAEINDQERPRAPARATPLRLASIAVVIPGVLLLAPVLVIAAATVMGPLLAGIAIPNFERIEARFRQASLYRAYTLPVDSSISASDAGHALVNLMQIGQGQSDRIEQKPTRTYPPLGLRMDQFPWGRDTLAFMLRRRSFTVAQLAQMDTLASHPAHAELSYLARASNIDVVGTRWRTPFPDSLAMVSLPIPKFGYSRELAYAHVMRGYRQFLNGQGDDAELSMRETISFGFVLMDHGVTLIEALIGRVIMQAGVNGLYVIKRAAGDDAGANTLAAHFDAEQIMDRIPRRRADLPEALAALPRHAQDATLPRSLRWESFAAFNMFGPCINLNRAVFPSNEQHQQWLARARAALIRFPADSALFELALQRPMLPRSQRPFRCAPPRGILRML